MAANLLSPYIQYGFAGFCFVLLGIIVWLIRNLLQVLKANNDVISENTGAIRELAKTVTEMALLQRNIHDRLLARPCIAHPTD